MAREICCENRSNGTEVERGRTHTHTHNGNLISVILLPLKNT